MRTIETTAVVTPNHSMTIQVPADIPAGSHQVFVVMEPSPESKFVLDLPVRDPGSWPEGFTASREQIYGDDGR